MYNKIMRLSCDKSHDSNILDNQELSIFTSLIVTGNIRNQIPEAIRKCPAFLNSMLGNQTQIRYCTGDDI